MQKLVIRFVRPNFPTLEEKVMENQPIAILGTTECTPVVLKILWKECRKTAICRYSVDVGLRAAAP
jgi:hypothetical protein